MEKLTRFCLKLIQNFLPTTWVIAIFLTFLTILLALGFTNKGLLDLAGYWGKGFSTMYVFGMQMVLVLITGYILALTPIVQKIINKILFTKLSLAMGQN